MMHSSISASATAGDRAASRPMPWSSLAGLFAGFLLLYGFTASRGPQWQDSGFHILRIVTGEMTNPLGLALSHPLHYLLGRAAVAAGLVQPSLAITLVSSLFGAITVACVFGCVFQLTRSAPGAFVAAISLGLAHTFWRMATLTESYTIVTALLAAECWSLTAWLRTQRRETLWCAALCNGLGVANHLLAVLTTPVVVVVAAWAIFRRQLSGKAFIGGIALWLIGASAYLLLIAAELGRASDPIAVLHSALFGHEYANNVLNLLPSARMAAIAAAFTVLSFPNLLLPLSAVGIVRGHVVIGTARTGVLLAGLLIHAAFAVRYSVSDQHLFFLPTYLYLSILGGVGFAAVDARVGPSARRTVHVVTAILLLCTPAVYWPAPEVARGLKVLEGQHRNKPYRDDYRYLFWPWSVFETSAERMSRVALDLAGDSGLIIVGDPMAEFAVQYGAFMCETGRPTVIVQPLEQIESSVLTTARQAGRPVILVPQDTSVQPAAPPGSRWERLGDLYRLTSIP